MINQDESSDVERALLASFLHLANPESELFLKAMRKVKSSSFYSMSHRLIFDAISRTAKEGHRVDLITVTNFLERHKNLEKAGGFSYTAQILKENPSGANIIAYADIIRDYAIERFANDKLNEVIGMLNDRSNGTIHQRLGLIDSTVASISERGLIGNTGGLKHIGESLGGWLDNIDQVLDDGFDKNAFSTGVESLDDVLGVKGMRRGSLVGVGARPKMGKSAFMMLLANHFALDLNESVAVFSMEMPSVEIAERAMTNRTMVNPAEFYRSGISNESQGRRDTAFKEILNSRMFVDDGSGLTLSHIQRESRKIRRENGSIGLICVDYLTLMQAEKAERNDLAYGLITKALKNLAKELNCVVVLLTQLNRGLESRPDKKPMPSDSRDTGQIEQDVDLWIGLYKESVYDEEVKSQGFTELLVRLNRHGGTGSGYVDMRQGFHVPMNTIEGQKIIHLREQDKSKETESESFTYKRKK